jgi:mRNA-degrading endonuclease toxin of MazEF toxin-antitoxin module
MVDYVPARGEFIWLNFDPQSGHEQMGKRPALVVSHTEFNLQRGFILLSLFALLATPSAKIPFTSIFLKVWR